MNIICITSRDELNLIDVDQIACVQANGNYSNIVYIQGQKLTVALGLSHLEQLLQQAVAVDPRKRSSFHRLGRSVVVNMRYLVRVDMTKQKAVISDRGKNALQILVPKQTLRAFKEYIQQLYAVKEK